MSRYTESRQKPVKIALLGASFDTGNMGVGALAESTVECVLQQWPDAEMLFLGSGWKVGSEYLRRDGKELCIKKLPIRFCKNLFLPNHFCVLFFYALLFKIFRCESFKQLCSSRNSCLREIVETDIVVDITGGDSFSDIYGIRRYVLGFLRKWLIILFGKCFIMLPQTYGPFKVKITKRMARYILDHACVIYSRDQGSIRYLNKLFKDRYNSKVKFSPDVAFVLDSCKPANLVIEPSTSIRAKSSTVVGLNISGLLFNGGYNRNNMFNLKSNYRELIYRVIEMLMQNDKLGILLIPHVFPFKTGDVESDPEACSYVFQEMEKKYSGRISLVIGRYNQNEIKYIIGMCDFFIGSRMHSCIAAMSQNIPTIGLAYSKKFRGVFESAGVEKSVFNMCSCPQDEILEGVEDAFRKRDIMAEQLSIVIPEVKKKVLSIFKEISLRSGN